MWVKHTPLSCKIVVRKLEKDDVQEGRWRKSCSLRKWSSGKMSVIEKTGRKRIRNDNRKIRDDLQDRTGKGLLWWLGHVDTMGKKGLLKILINLCYEEKRWKTGQELDTKPPGKRWFSTPVTGMTAVTRRFPLPVWYRKRRNNVVVVKLYPSLNYHRSDGNEPTVLLGLLTKSIELLYKLKIIREILFI